MAAARILPNARTESPVSHMFGGHRGENRPDVALAHDHFPLRSLASLMGRPGQVASGAAVMVVGGSGYMQVGAVPVRLPLAVVAA